MGIKISTIVEEQAWKELKDLSDETHQSLSGLLTEAMKDLVRKKRVRPDFLKQAAQSIKENEKLGKLLAR